MQRIIFAGLICIFSFVIFAAPLQAIVGKLESPEITKISDRKTPIWVYDRKTKQLVGQAEYSMEKRGWFIDFPARNSEYIAVWPGGEAVVTSPSITKGEIYNYSAVAGVTVLGVAVAATSMGESGDSSTWSEPPPSSIPTCDELGGAYSTSGSQVSSDCDDAAETYSQGITVSCVSGFLVIVVSRTFDTMNGSYDEKNGKLRAEGSSQDESTALSFEGTAHKDISNPREIRIGGLLTVRPESNCRTIYDLDLRKN
ncbi:MAG: hypothetical protein OEV64_04495 [Desulfobulbaceae bacterium]|nr:hypothetical protein [Desulfobulbaceae bacterium]